MIYGVCVCVCVGCFPGAQIPIIDFVLRGIDKGMLANIGPRLHIEFQRVFLGAGKKCPSINYAH